MPSEADEFLDVAAALARRIADAATWSGDRCNWIGALPLDEAGLSQQGATQAALGPDLYAGTAGVALFLAEAAARLGDERSRTAALGAARHALEHAADIDPEVRDGLYAGQIGIAYAAARVALLLDDDAVLARARGLLSSWRRERVPAEASDVVAGGAGAVAGLLALRESIDDAWLLDAAIEVGDELIGKAEVTSSGWSWPAPRGRALFNLCGFSHGAAGIGVALLELFGATGDTRFREAGEGAFDYERSWLEAGEANWPDLRAIPRRAGRDVPAPVSDSWCHGAPGIALARLRAARMLGHGASRSDAVVALDVTRRLVSGLLEHGADDFSLCHGAAGAADVLLYAAEAGAGPADASELAAGIGRLGIAQHHGTAVGFPCGIPNGQTPGLFLGLAGIGLFYLRLVDSGVPTTLVIHRRGALDTRARSRLESGSLPR